MQRRVLLWAVRAFGDVATNRRERAARFLEEAAELCQTQGLDEDMATRVLRRAFARRPGSKTHEVGDAGLTLLALAENDGVDFETAVLRRMRELEELSREALISRHEKKVGDGTAVDPGREYVDQG